MNGKNKTLNKKKGRKEEKENNNYENQFKAYSLVQKHILYSIILYQWALLLHHMTAFLKYLKGLLL